MIHHPSRVPLARTSRLVLFGLLTAGALVAIGLVVALYLGGATWAVNRALGAINPYPSTTLRSTSVTGNLLTALRLHDVRLTRAAGDIPIRLDSVELRYDLRQLLGDNVRIREIRLFGPRVVLRQSGDSAWDLPLPPRGSARSPSTTESQPSARRGIEIGQVTIDHGLVEVRFAGTRDGQVLRIENLRSEGNEIRIAGGIRIRQAAIHLVIHGGGSLDGTVVDATGSVVPDQVNLAQLTVRSPTSAVSAKGSMPLSSGTNHPPDLSKFALHLDARPLAFRDLALLHTGFDRAGNVGFTLDANGKERGVNLRLSAGFSDGGSARVEGFLTPPGGTPLVYGGHATLRRLDPSLFTLRPSRGERVNGDLRIDLRGSRADSLDGSAEVRLYDSRYGSFGARRVAAKAAVAAGRARMGINAEAGPVALGLSGWLRPFDAEPSYDLTARLRLARTDTALVWLDRLLGDGGTGLMLRVQGRSFDPGQADARAIATVIPGAAPGGLLESGSVQARLNAGTAHVRGRIGAAGGLVVFRGQATLDKELSYRIDSGSIDRVSPAAFLGDTTASDLNATFSLRGRGTGSEAAQVRASVLVTRATYGAHLLTGARVRLTLVRGTARLTALGDVDGASLDVEGTAAPFSRELRFLVRRLGFRHLDLARIAPGAGISSDLSGTGTLRGHGREPQRMQLAGRILLEPSRIGDEPLERGNIDASLRRGDLKLRAQLAGPAGQIVLAGTARPFDPTPRYSVRDATFRDLELGRFLPGRGLRTRLTGSLALEGKGRRPESAELTGVLRLDTSTVNRGKIRSGRLEFGLADGRLRLVGGLQGDGDSLTIDASSEPFANPPRVRLAAEVGVRDLAAFLERDSLDAGGAARVVVDGEWGKPETMRLRGEIDGVGHYAGLSVDSLHANLGLADGTVDVDTLSIRSNVGAASGAGTIALFGRGTERRSAFRLDADVSNLAPLGPALGLDGLALDSGHVTLSVDGSADRAHVSAGLEATNLAMGPQRVHVVQVSLEGDLGEDRSLVGGEGNLLLQHLTVAGGHIGRIRVQGSYRNRVLSLHGESDLDRLRHARMALRVYTDTAERRMALDTLQVTSGSEIWALNHPVAVTYGDRFRVEDFALTSRGRRLAIDGIVDRRSEQSFGVKIDSLPVDWLASLLGVADVSGVANGSLTLGGPATAPRLSGTLAVGLRSRGKKVGRASARVDWSGDRGLHLDLNVYHPKGDSLRVAGQVPVALSLATGDSSQGLVSRIPQGELAVDAAAHNFRIDAFKALLDPTTVKTLNGRLTVDAHAKGSLEAPELSGELDLTEAKLQLPSLGATYRNGRVKATLEGRAIRLAEARFESGDGHMAAEGRIGIGEASGALLDLDATLQDFRLADGENLGATASGKLNLGGTSSAPVLAGSLTLRDVDFYLQAKSESQAADDVELTAADRRILEDRFGLVADQPLGQTRSQLAMDVELALAGNNWLRRRSGPAVAVELSGKLTVKKTAGQEVEVYGAIQPLPGRSFVELLGRRFDVKSGEVGLNGPLKDARLRLNAEYRADSGSSTTPSGVIITTQLSADTGQLAVTLGSRPKLSDADIRSYLATGRPAGTDPTQTGGETNPLTAGASLAVGAALSTVAGGAGRKVGVDVVQVLQDRNGNQTLVAGKYVSPPLYLGFREPIMARDDPTKPQSARTTTEWEVEYAALEKALLNLQGSGSEFRVFLRLRR